MIVDFSYQLRNKNIQRLIKDNIKCIGSINDRIYSKYNFTARDNHFVSFNHEFICFVRHSQAATIVAVVVVVVVTAIGVEYALGGDKGKGDQQPHICRSIYLCVVPAIITHRLYNSLGVVFDFSFKKHMFHYCGSFVYYESDKYLQQCASTVQCIAMRRIFCASEMYSI